MAAGVLSHEQEVFMQDNYRLFNPDKIGEIESVQPDLAKVTAAAERLRALQAYSEGQASR